MKRLELFKFTSYLFKALKISYLSLFILFVEGPSILGSR